VSLAPGTRLGPYEITGQIGAGGMGEVYRATDANLGRQVAIKVLPDAIAQDPERVARFEREARTLATLNHPNIAIVHGFEKGDGVRALVMELVEGPTLADRLAQGPLPVDEALPIAKQIADALEAAHEQGIIHRDLKPANIKVRDDGTVKVLDFGLAKALEPPSAAGSDATASPTITSPALMTGVGVLLGTAAYMSPEQAKGKPADKRSDIWAFGCVLYEMLTGKRAFHGEDVSDTLAAVLRSEPDWTTLPPNVSPGIVALTRGCLHKDRRRRIADISTARFVIDDGSYPAAVAPTPRAPWMRRSALALMALAAVALIGSYATWMFTTRPPPSLPLTRFAIPLPPGERFTSVGRHLVALSPDGHHIVYSANRRLYLRAMDQLEAVPLRGTEGSEEEAGRSPFFSPDGQWVGFWQAGYLKKVSITGGSPVVLVQAENPFGASWTDDDTILYGQGSDGIWRVSGNGGKPEQVVKVDADHAAHGPQLLPGGRAILFTLADTSDWDAAKIVVHSLQTGMLHTILEGGTDARYLSTRHLIYAVRNTLFAVPFDVETLAVTGGPVPVVEGVGRPGDGFTGAVHFAVSVDGALVYVPEDSLTPTQPRTLVWVDRSGGESPINAPPAVYFDPRLSSDGTRVALDTNDREQDIWILDLARGAPTRVTFGPAVDFPSVWMPDGRAVVFSSGQFGLTRKLFRREADGTGDPEQLTQGESMDIPFVVTKDGKGLIFGQQNPRTLASTSPTRPAVLNMDIMFLPLVGERQPQPLVRTPFVETNAELSPDGRWLAYQSNESGRNEIYVRPFPNVTAAKSQVSTGGGYQPLWARSGRELFYLWMGALMSVPVAPGAAFTPGTPAKLLDAPYDFDQPGSSRMYDVSGDGKRFLMIKDIETPNAPQASIVVVEHWFEELKRLVPTK
jgi:serine/threonine protein kinase/Tol biopolymer transport system component